jgi:hypothetical protein
MDSRTHWQRIRDSEVLEKEEDKEKGEMKKNSEERKKKKENQIIFHSMEISELFFFYKNCQCLFFFLWLECFMFLFCFHGGQWQERRKMGAEYKGMNFFGPKHS